MENRYQISTPNVDFDLIGRRLVFPLRWEYLASDNKSVLRVIVISVFVHLIVHGNLFMGHDGPGAVFGIAYFHI